MKPQPSLKILIADDSLWLQERLWMMLFELPGTEVVGQTTTGIDTIQAVQKLQPDVVILDVRMPGGNGIQVLRTIKATACPPRVIVQTVFPTPQYQQRCLSAGADCFLDKMTALERIPQVLQHWLTCGEDQRQDSSISLV
ncbi:MAG: response regulator transcription factor [Anaerolineae bacterium]